MTNSPHRTIRALILDFGGVLVTMPGDSPSARRLAAEMGLTHDRLIPEILDSEEWQQALVGKIDAEELDRRLHARFGLSWKTGQPSIIARWFADEQLSHELLELADSLRRPPDFQVAVLSNAATDLEQQILHEKLDILHRFDLVINSARVGLRKPDPAIYRLTLERLGVAPHQAIFVDDMPVNIAAAAELGLHAIHFQSQRQAVDAIRSALSAPPVAAFA